MTSLFLRKSQFRDYVAIDILDENGKVIRTPVYITHTQPQVVLNFDEEQKGWFRTSLLLRWPEILCVDIDEKSDCIGLEFECRPEDLLDKQQFKF